LGHKNWEALSPNAPVGYGPACKAKVSHIDEHFAALCFWLNSSKSGKSVDLRTNAFSTSTKCKSRENRFWICWSLYFIFDS